VAMVRKCLPFLIWKRNSLGKVGMFLAISRFAVANEMSEEVRCAFLARPHHVDVAPGFVRMEVANPTHDSNEFWLLTWWRNEQDFQTWHRSHAYRDSHSGIPKGLKLDPSRTSMTYLDVVAT